jgi:hypothetical protein
MSSQWRFSTLFPCITLSFPLTVGNVCLKNIGTIAVRLTVTAAVSCILLSTPPATEHAAAAITQVTDISPEGLGIALETFARDRKLNYASDDVGNRLTEGTVGNLSAGDALKATSQRHRPVQICIPAGVLPDVLDRPGAQISDHV